MKLPTKPTSNNDVITNYKTMIYSPPEILPAKYAQLWPTPLFVDLDGRLNSLSIFKVPEQNVIDSWVELRNLIKILSTSEKTQFSTLVFDNAEGLFRLCSNHILSNNPKLSQLNDGYSKGWVLLFDELFSFWRSLSTIPQSIVFTSFGRSENIEPKHAEPYVKYVPNITDRFQKWLIERLDLVLFVNYSPDRKSKNLYSEPNKSYIAKNLSNISIEDGMVLTKANIEKILGGEK